MRVVQSQESRVKAELGLLTLDDLNNQMWNLDAHQLINSIFINFVNLFPLLGNLAGEFLLVQPDNFTYSVLHISGVHLLPPLIPPCQGGDRKSSSLPLERGETGNQVPSP
jgi:hypothetical protein